MDALLRCGGILEQISNSKYSPKYICRQSIWFSDLVWGDWKQIDDRDCNIHAFRSVVPSAPRPAREGWTSYSFLSLCFPAQSAYESGNGRAWRFAQQDWDAPVTDYRALWWALKMMENSKYAFEEIRAISQMPSSVRLNVSPYGSHWVIIKISWSQLSPQFIVMKDWILSTLDLAMLVAFKVNSTLRGEKTTLWQQQFLICPTTLHPLRISDASLWLIELLN